MKHYALLAPEDVVRFCVASCMIVSVLPLATCGGKLESDSSPTHTDGSLPLGGGSSTGGRLNSETTETTTKNTGAASSTPADPANATSSGISTATGGTSGIPGTCGIVSQLTEQAVPICTFAGGNHVTASGCASRLVTLYRDSTHSYVAVDWNTDIVQCPNGAVDSPVFESPGVYTGGDRTDTLSVQILSSGMIRLVCETDDRSGAGWYYDYTCSPNGILTILPCLKAGNIWVVFPATATDSGYEGRIDYMMDVCSPTNGKGISFTSTAGDNLALGTRPITCAPDGNAFWFEDLKGHEVKITFVSSQVVDVQRY